MFLIKNIFTYIIVFNLVLVVNQISYGSCFEFYCISAALGKVSIIAVMITLIISGANDWFYDPTLSNSNEYSGTKYDNNIRGVSNLQSEDEEENNISNINPHSKHEAILTYNSDEKDLWYGIGVMGLIVYDPDIQLGDDSVLLYVLGENDVCKYLSQEIRVLVKSINEQASIDKLLVKYKEWTKFQTSKLKMLADKKAISYKVLNLDVERKHAERLQGLKRKNLGVSIKPSFKQRETHCYYCTNNIDNTKFLECNSCSWIICPCGACGCGYGN